MNRTTITLSGLLLLASGAACSLAYNEYLRYTALRHCAERENVYACRWDAVPTVAPRVVQLAPAMLMPPAAL